MALSPFAPVQLAVIQPWLRGVARQAKAGHGVNILMQQAAFQQLAHQYRNAACRPEVVDIRRAVGIERRASSGTTSDRSEKSSQLMIIPAARAIATGA